MVTIKQANRIILHVARNRNKTDLCLSHFAVLAYLYESIRFCTVPELCSACGLSYHQTVASNKGSVLDILIKKRFIRVVEHKESVKNTILSRLKVGKY